MAQITSVELGASGRYIDLGSPAVLDDLTAYTCLAYCRPSSAGENNFGYLYGKVPSATLNGPRFFVGTSGYFTFGAHSATAGAPSRASANNTYTLNTWAHFASTWDGTLTAANIHHYFGAGVDLAEVGSYGATTNGTTAITSDAANNVFLLNRAGLGRAFVGDVAYVAIWNRVLTPAELITAQNSGPLDVPSGLVLLWANQQDLGPNAITPAGRSAFVAGSLPPNTNLGGSTAVALEGAASANATATGDIAGGISLGGVATGVATGAGGIDLSVPVEGSAASQATASGSMDAVVTILSPAERGTLELANCSVTPNGLTPTITLKNRWIAGENAIAARMMYGKVSGVLGMTPSFRLSRTDFEGTIQTAKKFAYSYDKVTWYEMANRSNDASYFYFSHNAAFTGNDVYFASQVPWLIEHTLPWIQSLEASGYVSEAPSSSGGGYVFATRSATQNELAEAIAAIPLYSFKVSSGAGNAPDGMPKRKMVLLSGTHASEDIGNYCLKGAVEFLTSGDAQALSVLSWFDGFVYPMVSSAGRQGGGTRNDFQTGLITADSNRNWHNSNIETLVAHKAAIATDCGSVVPVVMDFHGHQNSASTYNYVQNGSDSATWQAAILAYRASQSFTPWNTAGTLNYWAQSALSPDINLTPEYPFYYATTMGDTLDYGADHMRAVSDIASTGYWANVRGSAVAQATASAGLTVDIQVAGAGIAVADSNGALSVTSTAMLAGVASSTPSASGGLSLTVPLSGSSVAAALASAGLTITSSGLSGSAATGNDLLHAKPIETSYADAAWTTTGESMHGALDDLHGDDGQYIESTSTTEAYVHLKLAPIPDPNISTGHKLRYRASAPDAGGGGMMSVQLYCGATLIRNVLMFTVLPSPTQYTVNLTANQTDLITDYSDLWVKVINMGNETALRVHSVDLEVTQEGAGASGELGVAKPMVGSTVDLALPIDTIANNGWATFPGGALWEVLDDAFGDDSAFAFSAAGGELVVKLSPIPDPNVSTGHRVVLQAAAGTPGGMVNVVLYQGSTLVANAIWNNIPVGSYGEMVIDLTPEQADSITDYSDLRISVWRLSQAIYLSKAYLAVEKPVSSASGEISLNVSLSGAAIAEAAASAGLLVTNTQSLAGAAAGQSSASGNLSIGIQLSGAALTVASANGAPTQIVPIAGAAAAASLMTGGLDVSVQLAASALAQALAAAGLTTDGGLSAAAEAGAFSTGVITLRINLDGTAISSAVLSGGLTTSGVQVAGTPGWSFAEPARSWRFT